MSSITFIQGDIRDKKMCETVVYQQDYIFHLAAQVSVQESQEKPDYCYDVNVTGTHIILEALRITENKAKFIFSSSCAVYGNQSEPCHESMQPAPTSVYAYSKLMGELLCQQYYKLYGIASVCLRYFNVYGTRQNPYGQYAGVYAKFSECMQKDKPITIFGDGMQSRDFISVKQVVQANMYVAQLNRSLLQGQPLNIGTGKARTVLDIFNDLKNQYHYTQDPQFKPSRSGDIFYSCAHVQEYEAVKHMFLQKG